MGLRLRCVRRALSLPGTICPRPSTSRGRAQRCVRRPRFFASPKRRRRPDLGGRTLSTAAEDRSRLPIPPGRRSGTTFRGRRLLEGAREPGRGSRTPWRTPENRMPVAHALSTASRNQIPVAERPLERRTTDRRCPTLRDWRREVGLLPGRNRPARRRQSARPAYVRLGMATPVADFLYPDPTTTPKEHAEAVRLESRGFGQALLQGHGFCHECRAAAEPSVRRSCCRYAACGHQMWCEGIAGCLLRSSYEDSCADVA